MSSLSFIKCFEYFVKSFDSIDQTSCFLGCFGTEQFAESNLNSGYLERNLALVASFDSSLLVIAEAACNINSRLECWNFTIVKSSFDLKTWSEQHRWRKPSNFPMCFLQLRLKV